MAKLNTNNSTSFALRDYHHAAKTFTSTAGYPLSPYYGFLFHVNLVFNTNVTPGRANETRTVSVLVKSADLPQFKLQTETLNQYNRKRLVHTKIEYQPIRLSFRDDVANYVRNIWIDYHSYVTNDPNISTQEYNLGVYNNIETRRYGLDASAAAASTHEPLLRSVDIFSMGNHQYSRMSLVNPVISSADFDNHSYDDSGGKTLELTLGIEYETVKYETGNTSDIPGFGDDNEQHYDTQRNVMKPGNMDNLEQTPTFAREVNRSPLPTAPDVSLTPRTEAQEQSRIIDAVPGNVNSSKRNQTKFTERKFFEIVQTSVSEFGRDRRPYVFPVAQAIDTAEDLVSLVQEESENFGNISSGSAVVSNGVNVGTTKVQRGVSNTPLTTPQSTGTNAIVITPQVPTGLSPVEVELFRRSYPPIFSTDPRSKLPPYV